MLIQFSYGKGNKNSSFTLSELFYTLSGFKQHFWTGADLPQLIYILHPINSYWGKAASKPSPQARQSSSLQEIFQTVQPFISARNPYWLQPQLMLLSKARGNHCSGWTLSESCNQIYNPGITSSIKLQTVHNHTMWWILQLIRARKQFKFILRKFAINK